MKRRASIPLSGSLGVLVVELLNLVAFAAENECARVHRLGRALPVRHAQRPCGAKVASSRTCKHLRLKAKKLRQVA
jgi:hypothetical protein